MLTDAEKKVIFFIIAVLIVGSIIRYFYPDVTEVSSDITPFPVDINNATIEDLTVLPGVGEVYAERIIKLRNKNKGFERKEDLMEVKGIGLKTFEKIKDKIFIGDYHDN